LQRDIGGLIIGEFSKQKAAQESYSFELAHGELAMELWVGGKWNVNN
jgi:hypothetical protein